MRVKNNKVKPIVKSEAESIVASSNIKIFMKLDDPNDTFDLFKKSQKEQFISPNQLLKQLQK